ncbi:MAG TPA: pyridoxal phosphate-dependent aminotransferase [Thermoanaerobaculia bacterium]|nr:pyridoxal phosphate-dependent aminotransferase [Thermoanaerobaculia bacterium]
MNLSSRMSRIGESATLKVSRRAAELRARGVDVVDFGAGEPDFDSPSVAVEAAREALARGFTRYTPGSGLPALRADLAASFAARHGAPWTSAQSIVTVGGKAALFEIALAVFEAGQEVIVPSPCWVSFPEQIRFAGAEPVAVQTSGEDGFRIHAGPILDAVTDRTRAIVLNSPCNPTGGVVGEEDLREIVAGAARRGILVISDETYERFLYDGASHASAAALAAEFPQTVVLVGSFSKTYAMTGWRIGYALGPAPVICAVEQIQSHATSNPTSFAMVGALEALRHAEPEVAEMIAAYEERRDFLIPRLNALPGFECRPPAGAFYAFPCVREAFGSGRQGSVELAEILLEEARVAVVPGKAFGADDHIRISFACSQATLARGLERMAEVLARLEPAGARRAL